MRVALYSDLGYILAGAMIQRVAKQSLSSLWTQVCGIPNAHDYRMHDPSFDARVIPTEITPSRGLICGVVHDENAYALECANGHPGHAGAFATVDKLIALAIRCVDVLQSRTQNKNFVSLASLEEMIRPRDTHSLRLGWDSVSPVNSSAGQHFGARTFGHLGFTGTSVWIDPDAQVVAVLLTNRTFPTRANIAIRQARPRIHNALWAWHHHGWE